MEIDEFTDTYSDDLIHLQEARVALLTHPLRNEHQQDNMATHDCCYDEQVNKKQIL